MTTAIRIGASPKAVEAARTAILAILDPPVPRDEKTIRAALAAFVQVCEVRGASITGCTFTMGKPEKDQ